MLINCLMVSIGAVFGVLGRIFVTRWISRKWAHDFPMGTFLINIGGCFALGIVSALHFGTWLSLLLMTGFLGTFTTFSTFNVENIELMRRGKYTTLISYAGGSYLFGILAVFAGLILGSM
ncbi:fluoride efflux transporter CrcB [Sporolactobacillus pectinivorans]|uniref:fluoride efflux transporter CrcB n=1 Tax=Sporolactobacillus pectinivorans TaxID=1591408 RepID=UPI000C25A7E2|nr:fluoride efflux transporter CrcB [Sporolactobacillus pectinivorans]